MAPSENGTITRKIAIKTHATPFTPRRLRRSVPVWAQRLLDLIHVQHAVIVDVKATTAVRQAEVGAAQTMLTRTADRFGLWPERLIADTPYGSAAMLNWLVHEQGIEPHIPVFDKSTRRDRTFSRPDFAYDHQGDFYICQRQGTAALPPPSPGPLRGHPDGT